MKKGTGTKVSHYQLGKEIGKGGFGTVYQGMDTETGRFVAVKQVNTADVPKETLESIHIEIKLLKKLQHDNMRLEMQGPSTTQRGVATKGTITTGALVSDGPRRNLHSRHQCRLS